MIKKAKILKAAILATTSMTAFSYLYCYLSGENTKEPVLLAKMFRRLFPGMTGIQSKITGWAVHYLVGLLFAEIYAELWERSSLQSNKETGLVFGGLSGFAAILIWKFMLAVHPFPPALNFKKFALNLFFAHVLFGFVAAIVLS